MYWSDYINDYLAFNYVFSIPISKANFKDKILFVDAAFLKAGAEQKLFVYPDAERSVSYLRRREEQFFSEKRQWISFLDFEQFADTSSGQFQIFLPDANGQLTPIPYRQPFINLKIFQIDNTSELHWLDVAQEDDWGREVLFSIRSNSTIWLENIGLSYGENSHVTILDPPVDNRFFAYRIVPRFNSFLRDITAAVESLGGEITLDEYGGTQVTEQGILLDGRLIFQEDIDAGKIELPI